MALRRGVNGRARRCEPWFGPVRPTVGATLRAPRLHSAASHTYLMTLKQPAGVALMGARAKHAVRPHSAVSTMAVHFRRFGGVRGRGT